MSKNQFYCIYGLLLGILNLVTAYHVQSKFIQVFAAILSVVGLVGSLVCLMAYHNERT